MKMILDIGESRTIEIFRRHGFNVVKLSLIRSRIDSYIEFAEILECMPNLKHIIIFETSTLRGVNDVPPEQGLPELKKLQTVEIVKNDYSIIKCFRRAKLKTIKILNASSLDCKPLEDFLQSQQMLKTLALRAVHHDTSMLFRTENLNTPMPFQLTQLSLLNIKLQKSPNDYNNLLKFLKPQAKTLKEMELGRNFPNFVYEFIFANMRNLKTLSLMMSEIPQNQEFYERLEENRSINNLILLDSTRFNEENSRFVCGFFEYLPNVTSLTLLEYCDYITLGVLAKCLIKLRTLATASFNEDGFHGVQFPNLTSLHVQKLDDIVDWNEFTKCCPRLTELTVEQILSPSFLTNDDIETITTNVSLQTLRLGENFEASERFFRIVRENCPDLKIFDLQTSSSSSELTHQTENWHGLRFCDIKFPEYFQLWNEDDYNDPFFGYFPLDVENDWDVGGDLIEPFDMQLLGEDFNLDIETETDSEYEQ